MKKMILIKFEFKKTQTNIQKQNKTHEKGRNGEKLHKNSTNQAIVLYI